MSDFQVQPERLLPCTADGPCQSYGAGHNMHVIHAQHIDRTPWGWRGATVTRVPDDGTFDARYDNGTVVRLWYHHDITWELRRGARVGLHEQYHALRCAAGLLNVTVDGGLGPVPSPDDPAWTSHIASPADGAAGGAQRDTHRAALVPASAPGMHVVFCDFCGWRASEEFGSTGRAAVAAGRHNVEANAHLRGPHDDGLGLRRPLTVEQRALVMAQRAVNAQQEI